MHDVRSLEAIGQAECLRLLSGAVVGRMVFTDGALPAVVPVTFAVDGDSVVCRTAGGSRLAQAADGGVLALEADELDVPRRSGWSVVATGIAEVVTDDDEARRLAGLVQPWAPGTHDVTIRLRATVLTGRRVGDVPRPGLADGVA
jgi:nitroimidazol reductase NimA-like FMN-containing flavoprotein (pyridoxamine 5'-phosphate oxidase superfamily)